MDTSASRYFFMEIKTFTPLVLTHRPANLTTLPIRSLCERSSSLDAGRNSTAVYVIGSLQEPINASISSTPSGRSSRHELSIFVWLTKELRRCPALLVRRIRGLLPVGHVKTILSVLGSSLAAATRLAQLNHP